MTAEQRGSIQDSDGVWRHHFGDGRSVRMKERVCEQCDKVFYSYRDKRFCSAPCRRAFMFIAPKSNRCARCDREFFPHNDRQVFCSHRCAAEQMHAGRPVTTPVDFGAALVNSDNPHYTQDIQGQWWYQPGGEKVHSRTRATIKSCAVCEKGFLSCVHHSKKQLHCSKSCGLIAVCAADKGRYKGDKGSNWKGGRRMSKGYAQVWAPDHPTRVGKISPYVFEHRLVMEKVLGRYMKPSEQVHHKNGIRDDNRPENLELWVKQQPPGARVHEQQHCPTCSCFIVGAAA